MQDAQVTKSLIFCICSNELQTTFTIEKNTMNPDQTAPRKQYDLGPYYLQYRLSKFISR